MTDTGLNEPGAELQKTGVKPGFNIWQFAAVIVLVAAVFAATYFYMHSTRTPLMRAAKLIREGKAAIALPMLESLSREHPENPEVFPWLAQVYLSTDRLAEGRQH